MEISCILVYLRPQTQWQSDEAHEFILMTLLTKKVRGIIEGMNDTEISYKGNQ
jgi:hypothetical protein